MKLLNKSVRGVKRELERFLKEEDGMGTVEIVLIVLVLIGLVVIFKGQITAFVQQMMGKFNTSASGF